MGFSFSVNTDSMKQMSPRSRFFLRRILPLVLILVGGCLLAVFLPRAMRPKTATGADSSLEWAKPRTTEFKPPAQG
jgi:hypothetical protein